MISLDKINDYLKPLLDFASNNIPPTKISKTPLYLFATAGMRLLSVERQLLILEQCCKYTKNYYNFYIKECRDHFSVITGLYEGIYGWVAINYLKNGFQSDKNTLGFLDMGGASAQIAFEPSREMATRHSDDLTQIKLRNGLGVDINFNIFTSTFLGYGVNEAQKLYRDFITRRTVDTEIADPCMPRGLTYPHTPFAIKGTGNYSKCIDILYTLLNKTLPCSDDPCYFNGVHIPLSDFNNKLFLGVSEYWHVSNTFQLDGVYSFDTFQNKTRSFCEDSWTGISNDFKKWKYTDLKLLETHCFKSSWVLNILYNGFEIPKQTSVFSSTDDVSWTLGSILFFACATIPSNQVTFTGNSISLVLIIIILLFAGFIYWKSRKRKFKYESQEFEDDIILDEIESGADYGYLISESDRSVSGIRKNSSFTRL